MNKTNTTGTQLQQKLSSPSSPKMESSKQQTEHEHAHDQDDYYGSRGSSEGLVVLFRMGVRLAILPLLLMALPALIRAAVTVLVSLVVAFAVALPFMVALASMTWRRLQHPAPARRFEPRPRPRRREGQGSRLENKDEDDDDDDRVIRKVAVIGGGAAGLAALRQMLNQGMDAVLFERSGDVGGLWNYDNEQTSKVFNSVTQNVTSLHNRFAGYPAPAHWPLYLGHAHTLEYLKGYAARFGLMRRVRLRREAGGSWSFHSHLTRSFILLVRLKARYLLDFF